MSQLLKIGLYHKIIYQLVFGICKIWILIFLLDDKIL